MESHRIRLKILGLSTEPISKGTYALILAQADGPVRIPVIIGEAEARSIASKMEHMELPRPLTHDLFATFTHAFGIAMEEVFIHSFENGLFLSEISFTNGERRVTLEARTSDALAIAMRTNAPIYTTEKILHECGFVIEGQVKQSTPSPIQEAATEPTLEQLQSSLNEAIEREDYEEAARITEIIKSKSNKQ